MHCIVPTIASTSLSRPLYTLVLMTYTYTYAVSALAGLGLIRNLADGGLRVPLFAEQMCHQRWAISGLGRDSSFPGGGAYTEKYWILLRQRSLNEDDARGGHDVAEHRCLNSSQIACIKEM